MLEIKVKGIVKERGYEWHLETDNEQYNADILQGIDYILDSQNEDILEDGDEVELIIKINRK